MCLSLFVANVWSNHNTLSSHKELFSPKIEIEVTCQHLNRGHKQRETAWLEVRNEQSRECLTNPYSLRVFSRWRPREAMRRTFFCERWRRTCTRQIFAQAPCKVRTGQSLRRQVLELLLVVLIVAIALATIDHVAMVVAHGASKQDILLGIFHSREMILRSRRDR